MKSSAVLHDLVGHCHGLHRGDARRLNSPAPPRWVPRRRPVQVHRVGHPGSAERVELRAVDVGGEPKRAGVDGGHAHRCLHDGEPGVFARRVLEDDGVAHRHAQAVGGLAGQHQAGAALTESSLLEGGCPNLAVEVDGLEDHLDVLVVGSRQRAAEPEHGFHGADGARCRARQLWAVSMTCRRAWRTPVGVCPSSSASLRSIVA
jgi:hypothetical protein